MGKKEGKNGLEKSVPWIYQFLGNLMQLHTRKYEIHFGWKGHLTENTALQSSC